MERERRRAEDALAKAQAVAGERFEASYLSYVDRFGGAILMNGLGQAIATELAAAGGDQTDGEKAAHRRLADNVCSWLTAAGIYTGEDVMAAIVAGDQASYRRAQAEALAWLTWHKKFCHASLKKDGAR